MKLYYDLESNFLEELENKTVETVQDFIKKNPLKLTGEPVVKFKNCSEYNMEVSLSIVIFNAIFPSLTCLKKLEEEIEKTLFKIMNKYDITLIYSIETYGEYIEKGNILRPNPEISKFSFSVLYKDDDGMNYSIAPTKENEKLKSEFEKFMSLFKINDNFNCLETNHTRKIKKQHPFYINFSDDEGVVFKIYDNFDQKEYKKIIGFEELYKIKEKQNKEIQNILELKQELLKEIQIHDKESITSGEQIIVLNELQNFSSEYDPFSETYHMNFLKSKFATSDLSTLKDKALKQIDKKVKKEKIKKLVTVTPLNAFQKLYFKEFGTFIKSSEIDKKIPKLFTFNIDQSEMEKYLQNNFNQKIESITEGIDELKEKTKTKAKDPIFLQMGEILIIKNKRKCELYIKKSL